MENRVDKALLNHRKGYNCSQSVACAYCDLVGIDEKTMFQLMEGFGLGMGNMEGTCGAVTGAVAIAGMKHSAGNINGPYSKGKTYHISKKIIDEFQTKNQSIVCKELKGVHNGTVLRSCDGCIQDAAEILESILRG